MLAGARDNFRLPFLSRPKIPTRHASLERFVKISVNLGQLYLGVLFNAVCRFTERLWKRCNYFNFFVCTHCPNLGTPIGQVIKFAV